MEQKENRLPENVRKRIEQIHDAFTLMWDYKMFDEQRAYKYENKGDKVLFYYSFDLPDGYYVDLVTLGFDYNDDRSEVCDFVIVTSPDGSKSKRHITFLDCIED